jgi:hypothetical protein
MRLYEWRCPHQKTIYTAQSLRRKTVARNLLTTWVVLCKSSRQLAYCHVNQATTRCRTTQASSYKQSGQYICDSFRQKLCCVNRPLRNNTSRITFPQFLNVKMLFACSLVHLSKSSQMIKPHLQGFIFWMDQIQASLIGYCVSNKIWRDVTHWLRYRRVNIHKYKSDNCQQYVFTTGL